MLDFDFALSAIAASISSNPAQRPYGAASASSTSPSLYLTLVAAGATPLVDSVGNLAPDGTGSTSLVVAAALGQTAIGLTVHHAFVTLGPLGVDFVSNAAPLTIE